MTIKARLLAISLLFGILPVVVMFVAANQAGLSMNREFFNTMAIALMVTLLAGLTTPGIIRYWLFSSQIQQIKEFCQQVKGGRYDVYLNVPNESNDDGNENELVDLMRDMNWMLHRIKVNASELRQAVTDLEQSKAEVQSQKHELEVVNAEQLVVQHQLQGRTRELSEAVGKVRNLLDNAGQGFLSFGEDLKATGEYSAECVMIFNKEIAGELVPELLYLEDTGQQTFLTALFNKIFQEEDAFLRESYFSLLPEELVFDESFIQIAYKLINHPIDPERREILLILTDITRQREMEKKIQEEKNVLTMVVRAVTHYQEFSKAITEYELFCREELPDILFSSETVLHKINVIFRAVHTWKGTFGQLGIYRLAAKLHELESALAALRDESKGIIGESGLTDCFTVYSPAVLAGWLEQELEQLKKVLGEHFFQTLDTVVVENSKLHQLEDKVQRLLAPCQARTLIAELRQLRYKPFNDLLAMFPEYITNIAANQGKDIHPLVIAGAKTLVDPVKYHDFAKSLVHVFRNAVAHGLETADERLAAGKDIQGRIACHIAEADGHMTVTIADDGRGIDHELMRRLAVGKGICNEVDAQRLSDSEAVQLIFADGFSSMCVADSLSGRGVGLSAVKAETEKLGGRIEITTEPGTGTQFSFILPLTDWVERGSFDVVHFGEMVLQQAKTMLQERFVLQPGSGLPIQYEQNVINMRNVSTFIDIKGRFPGRLMISADESVVQRLAGRPAENLEAGEYGKIWLESVFSEFFNTIVGNSLQLIPDWQEELDIGTPVTIWAKGASAKYAEADIYSWQLTTELGEVNLSLISFMRRDGEENGACISC